MNKSLILVVFLYLTVFFQEAIAQKYFNILDIPRDLPIKDDKIIYQGIIEIEGASMKELYGFAKKFIAETYNSTDAAIDMDDTLNGVIVVKGRSEVPISWVQKVGGRIETVNDKASTKHLLIFEMKDNRIRFTLKDLVLDSKVFYTSFYQVVDFNIPIEYHLNLRKTYNPSKKYKPFEIRQMNFSAAYLVACHKYFTDFGNRIEPYFKNQKSEVW